MVARKDDYVVAKTAARMENSKAEQLVAVKVVLLAAESGLKRVGLMASRRVEMKVERTADMRESLLVCGTVG